MGALCNHSLELTGLAGDPGSPVHRLDPRAKILGLFGVTVVAVTTPLGAWPVYVACAAVLVAVAGAGRVSPRDIWRRARIVLTLVLVVAVVVPFVRTGGSAYELGPLTVHEGGLAVLATVASKATIGILAAVLVATTTTFPAVLRGLEALRVPRVLVLIASFMYRYLFVIVEEVGRMRAGLLARGYRPSNALQAGAIGRAATALFLRSYDRGERVYLAMVARGYRGEMPQLVPMSFARADAAFVTLVLVSPVSVRTALALAG